jgi:DNA-binding NarL/FixJ family response regulator
MIASSDGSSVDVHNILSKLDVNSRTGAIAKAVTDRLLSI